MSKERIIQIAGIAGLALIIIGAMLYAVNSPQRALTAGLFVAGTLILFVYAMLNLQLIVAFFQKRSARYGANTIVMIIVFIGILVIIQALSVRHSFRYDLTRNKRFSLADQTATVLDSLQTDVEVIAFYKQGVVDRFRAEDIFGQFTHRSARFRYEFVDPDQKPQLAKDMSVATYGTTVVQSGNKRAYVKDLTEEKLLNAVVKVTRHVVKVIYFVKGHGEKDPANEKPGGYSIASGAIENENYEVRTLSLFDEMEVPGDCTILVVAGPKRDYFEAEIQKIEEYLKQGRNAFFLIDPQIDLPNIERLLLTFKIKINNDAVVDPHSRVFGGDYSVPVVTDYEEHPITTGFNVATFFPTARSVGIADIDVPSVNIQYLAKTGKSAWGETDLELIDRGQAVKDERDNPAPVPIGLVAEQRFDKGQPSPIGWDQSKVVVFGDSDFADNSAFRLTGNADLFLNIINYLAEEKNLIAIRAKKGLGDRLFLTDSQGRFIFLVSVILLPLGVILFGATVFVKRRSQG